MFSFEIEKTVDEIRQAMEAKAKSVRAKIAERQGRIARLREEYEIDDAALAQLFMAARRQANANAMRFSYSTSNKSATSGDDRMEEREIGAGVVNNLLTENDHVASEQADLKRLELVSRNLDSLARITDGGVQWTQTRFQLSHEELEYLGF